jgi:hypothetical protein
LGSNVSGTVTSASYALSSSFAPTIIPENLSVTTLTASYISASSGITGSLFGTSSWALNTVSYVTITSSVTSSISASQAYILNLTSSIISASSGITGSVLGTASWATYYGQTQIASGTSTSGTPNTNVATLNTSSVGNYFITWQFVSGQSSTANTQISSSVIYSDGTSIVDLSTANTSTMIYGHPGGIMRSISGASTALVAGLAKKAVKITILTAGSGTGTRNATISGVEVKQ